MNPRDEKTSTLPDVDMPENTQSLTRISFEVSGNCEMCKDRIEKAAKSVKGVNTASWDIATKEVAIEFNNTISHLDAIQKAIAAAGHDNGKYKADNEVYKKLPECCLYRK